MPEVKKRKYVNKDGVKKAEEFKTTGLERRELNMKEIRLKKAEVTEMEKTKSS